MERKTIKATIHEIIEDPTKKPILNADLTL